MLSFCFVQREYFQPLPVRRKTQDVMNISSATHLQARVEHPLYLTPPASRKPIPSHYHPSPSPHQTIGIITSSRSVTQKVGEVGRQKPHTRVAARAETSTPPLHISMMSHFTLSRVSSHNHNPSNLQLHTSSPFAGHGHQFICPAPSYPAGQMTFRICRLHEKEKKWGRGQRSACMPRSNLGLGASERKIFFCLRCVMQVGFFVHVTAVWRR